VKIGSPGQSGSRREGGAMAVDDYSSDLPAEGSSRQRQRPPRRAMSADPAEQCVAVPVGRRRGARRLLWRNAVKSAGVGGVVRQIPEAADPSEDDTRHAHEEAGTRGGHG